MAKKCCMENLTDYLDGRKKADFAKKIGVSPAQLSQYLSGYRRPSYELMLKIEVVTSGKVSLRSWSHTLANGYKSKPFQSPQKRGGGG